MPRTHRGVRLSSGDGYRKMYDPQPADDGLDFGRAVMDSPARLEILRFMQAARDLGLDASDPEVIRRALVAGLREHASRPAEPMPDPRRHEPAVYYMQTGNPVKIGTSSNVLSRIEALRPERLLALEPGGYDLEAERHRQFAASRSHGEWFRLTDELASHVEAVRQRFEVITGTTVDAWLAERSLPPKPPTLSESTRGPSPAGLAGTVSNR